MGKLTKLWKDPSFFFRGKSTISMGHGIAILTPHRVRWWRRPAMAKCHFDHSETPNRYFLVNIQKAFENGDL